AAPWPDPGPEKPTMPTRFVALALALFAAPVLAADTPSKQEKLDATVGQLQKDIEAVRGLKFKAPVKAKVIARPRETAKSLQGYYDLKEKALFVFDDLAGNYERGELTHEMDQDLQEQHFQ